MATIITADQATTEVVAPSFEAIQKAVGGYVELVSIPSDPDRVLAVNEDGGPFGLPSNKKASELAGRRIVGTVVVCDRSEIK